VSTEDTLGSLGLPSSHWVWSVSVTLHSVVDQRRGEGGGEEEEGVVIGHNNNYVFFSGKDPIPLFPIVKVEIICRMNVRTNWRWF